MFHLLTRYRVCIILAIILLVSLWFCLNSPGVQATPPPQPAAAQTTITFAYDAAGRLGMASYGSNKLLVYQYDANGNMVGITDHLSIYLPVMLKEFK